MSTRSQIGFYSKDDQYIDKHEALIYRHSDGYPSGVLPEILPYLLWFNKERGITDTEYVAARLLQYLCNVYDDHTKAFHEKLKKEDVSPMEHPDDSLEAPTGTLGHGICKQFHGDIEYYYAVYPTKLIVYEVDRGDWEKPICPCMFKELYNIPYNEEAVAALLDAVKDE